MLPPAESARYWWNCTADVKWYGKSPAETVAVKGSELTPEDIGKQVRVTSKNFGQPNDHDDNTMVYSDTTRPFWFLNVVMWGIIAILPGVAAITGIPRAFFPLSEWFDVDKDRYRKYYAKYVREGRLSPQEVRDLTPPKKEEEETPPPPPPGVPIDPPPPAPNQPGPGQQPPTNLGNGPGSGW